MFKYGDKCKLEIINKENGDILGTSVIIIEPCNFEYSVTEEQIGYGSDRLKGRSNVERIMDRLKEK